MCFFYHHAQERFCFQVNGCVNCFTADHGIRQQKLRAVVVHRFSKDSVRQWSWDNLELSATECFSCPSFAAFHRDEGVGDRSDGRSRFGIRVDYNNKEEKRDNKRER